MIWKEAWLFCRSNSGVRLCWELEEPKRTQVLWCFGALYYTHIVAPRDPNSYGVIRDKLRMKIESYPSRSILVMTFSRFLGDSALCALRFRFMGQGLGGEVSVIRFQGFGFMGECSGFSDQG